MKANFSRHSFQSARTRSGFAFVLLSALLLTGCGAEPAPHETPIHAAAAVPAPPSPPKPLLIHLPGISGELSVDRAMIRGLADGGFDGEVQVFDWSCNDPGLDALFARKRNMAEADRLAKAITEQAHKHPNQQITITGHSGGAGVAVWALEKLPSNVNITNLFLLAPALSPGYDLSPALHHVHGKAYAFTSQNDAVVLGVGTRLFATIDGQRVEAAGKVGFAMPPDAKDPKAYDKLVPMPYDDAWMELDNIGDHVGVLSQPFSAAVLAPLITGHSPAVTQKSATLDSSHDAGLAPMKSAVQ